MTTSNEQVRDPVLVVTGDDDGGLSYPLDDLPNIKTQRRKAPAKSNLQPWNMIGSDTETKFGKMWLFSTEKGVWETPTFAHLMQVLYNEQHTRKWKKGGKRGRRCLEHFFWNLKFDGQACLRLLSEQVCLDLISSRDDEDELGSNKVIVNADTGDYTPVVRGRMVKLDYLEGKSFIITPQNWYRGRFKLGPCHWWDIAQFYDKMRLNDAAQRYLNETKIEECFDGSILDASRFDDPDYTDYYREDIDEYAVQDAILAGKLARLRRDHFVNSEVRFIRPYSLANVAQRALLDTCSIPTINDYSRRDKPLYLLKAANTAYRGGWFETTGSGYHPDVTCMDLASAYPYIIYHLPDVDDREGAWIQGDGGEEFLEWLDCREPYTLGFCEAFFLFDAGLPWHPLARMSSTGTIVTPRMVRGWFTADEIAEALQWPHSQFILGRWFYFLDTETRPFRPFITRFYEMKENAQPGTPEYQVAKTCLNSIYGKQIQSVNNETGMLWNPLYAATVTGGTRARLAEFLRLNNYSAVGVATDGVLMPSDSLLEVPQRPLAAPSNLGEWEMEDRGELSLLMSGVYSIRTPTTIKTTYRGSASVFLRDYRRRGLFGFCDDHREEDTKSAVIRRPFSAKEARMRSDMTLMNVFSDFTYTIRPLGDSTKRLWAGRTPSTFGDLLSEWWTSEPHHQVH